MLKVLELFRIGVVFLHIQMMFEDLKCVNRLAKQNEVLGKAIYPNFTYCKCLKR